MLKKLINMWKDKWLEGSCRHFCFWCEHRKFCYYDYGLTRKDNEE